MKELRRHHDPLDPYTLPKERCLAVTLGSLILHRDVCLRAASILKQRQSVERYLTQEGCYAKDYILYWGHHYRPELLFGKRWRGEVEPSLELAPAVASIIAVEQKELEKYLIVVQ